MSAATPRPPRWRRAYPDRLLQAERARLLLRRAHLGQTIEPPEQELPADSLGLALSGGGIRSATFALGFFQGLGKARLLRRLDFLSTVSGGSYFGAVISSLMARPDGPSIEQVEDLLPETPPTDAREAPAKDGRPAPWLRRNGYYLAPNGGDVLLAGSIWLRNWLALHLVVLIALVTGGLLLQLPWVLLGYFDGEWPLPLSTALQSRLPPGTLISPWLDLTLLPLLLALAAGWAYWLLPGGATPVVGAVSPRRWSERLREPQPLLGAALVALLTALVAWSSLCPLRPLLPRWSWLPDIAVALLLAVLLSLAMVCWTLRRHGTANGLARNRLSRGLARYLGIAALLGLIALTDSLGLSAYASLFVEQSHWAGLTAFVGAVLAALSRLLLLPKKTREWLADKLPESQTLLSSLPQLSLRKLVPLVAALLALFWLSAAVTLGHAIVRDFGDPWLLRPVAATTVAAAAPAEDADEEAAAAAELGAEASATGKAEKTEKTGKEGALSAGAATKGQGAACPLAPAAKPQCPLPPSARLEPLGRSHLWPLLFGLLLLGPFSLLFGRTWSFVNRSSYQALYAARLTRAYVGAGNPERTRERKPVTDPLPNDDVPLAQFASADVQRQGGPLHLINLTVNETASANEGTVNRDRKGIGMSVGPCGFSAGVSHHALLLNGASELQALHRPATAQEREQNLTRYNMFGLARGASEAAPAQLEALTLAHWTAISGAAVAPGLGHYGGLGLSFLIAFANLRLGYWWGSGSDAYRATSVARSARRVERQLRRLLPVHYYLGLEFAGRFPGADEPYWYLTDGGHFENLGLYELVRRRLPLMVAVDAEADPEGRFESLVGVIGKARVDFGTDIEFLETAELTRLGLLLPGLIGPLEQLVATADGDAPATAKARMALARLKYPEGAPGWLLYLKAAYVGDEPRDLRAYRQRQPPFPHQTTGDQFFDETQWECYRKLGEHTAERLFGEGAPFHGLRVPDPPPPSPPQPQPQPQA